MSIALDNNRVEPNNGGFMHRNKKMSPFNLSPILDSKDRTVMRVVVQEERENGFHLDPSCSSSSSSSIGINSDVDDDDDHQQNDDDEQEVQSKLKTNHTFDSAVDALEEALPIRYFSTLISDFFIYYFFWVFFFMIWVFDLTTKVFIFISCIVSIFVRTSIYMF